MVYTCICIYIFYVCLFVMYVIFTCTLFFLYILYIYLFTIYVFDLPHVQSMYLKWLIKIIIIEVCLKV